MDQQAFNQAVERLKAVNAVVQELDPVLRDQAVDLLKPYITGGSVETHDDDDDGADAQDQKPKRTRERGGADLDLDDMHDKFASDKDYENAHLALAVYYARYGKGPLNLSRDLKPIGDELHVDLPGRLDRTFARLKFEGSPVVRKGADGYKIMPAGERFLKGKFGVSKGRASNPAEA
jgi:hypothetical protein